MDYVLDQNLDYEHRFLRRNRVLDEGSDASDEGDREEVDSDLDWWGDTGQRGMEMTDYEGMICFFAIYFMLLWLCLDNNV